MSRYRGQVGLIIVAAIWGSGFVASSIALKYYSPIQTLPIRFGIAAIVLMVIFWKRIIKSRFSTWMKGIILGLFIYFAFLFQTWGLLYTTPSKNAFLTATNVVVVPFMAFLIFRKTISLRKILGALLAIVGIGVLSLNGLSNINIGDILTLICAVFFAMQILFTSVFVKDEDPVVLTAIQMFVATIIGFCVSRVQGVTFFEDSLNGNFAMLYLGLISTLLAFLIQTISQKYTSSTETAVLLSTEAFFGMLFSIIILHERITVRMLVGAMIIFISILIVENISILKKE